MATASATLARPRRRPGNLPQRAGGRAVFRDIYFVKRIDNSRLCREVDPVKRRECFSLLALSVLIFLFGFLLAWQHFQCVRLGYQIEQLKTQRTGLEESNHQLRLEQAGLADPQRIDTLARVKLGMASPSPQQVIRVDPEVTVPVGNAELARNFAATEQILHEQ